MSALDAADCYELTVVLFLCGAATGWLGGWLCDLFSENRS